MASHTHLAFHCIFVNHSSHLHLQPGKIAPGTPPTTYSESPTAFASIAIVEKMMGHSTSIAQHQIKPKHQSPAVINPQASKGKSRGSKSVQLSRSLQLNRFLPSAHRQRSLFHLAMHLSGNPTFLELQNTSGPFIAAR